MSRAAKNPTLPQNDDPRAQQQRIAQLATTCESYVWTTAVPTLPGVPLAASVPSSDTPTVPWFGLVAGVALDIVRNVLALKLSGGSTNDAAAARDQQRTDEIEKSVAELAAPQASAQSADTFGAELREDVENGIKKVEELARAVRLRGHLDELRRMVETHSADAASSLTPGDYDAL